MPAAFLHACRDLPRRVARDRRGATAVMMALSMTVLVGFAGAGIDIAFWETTKRNMQGAADQAAYSAVIAANHSGSPIGNAQGVTAQMGFKGDATNCSQNSTTKVTVCVNNPPSQGAYRGNSAAWEVLITKPQPLWFSNLFLSSAPVATARAVAIRGSGGSYCMLILGSGPQVLKIQGTPSLNTPNCDIQVNSNDPAAVQLGGSAGIHARTLSMVGSPGYTNNGSGGISATIQSDAAALSDPYTDVTLPTPAPSAWLGPTQSSCQTVGNINNNQTKTLTPGCYTGSIAVNGTLIFTPGTYYIDQGSLSTNNGTITGAGVTIILTSSTGSNYSTVNFSGNAHVTLTPQTTGPYAGIAIYADRNAPTGTAQSLGGGGNFNVSGLLYLPTSALTFRGNSGIQPCAELIAWSVNLIGTSGFNSVCTGVGTRAIVGPTTYVAE